MEPALNRMPVMSTWILAENRSRAARLRQAGFAFIEMALVIFLMSLLLTGTLRGADLINSGSAKMLANDFRALPLLVRTYQDKYRALPGDDAGAAARFGAGTQAGNGNGVIDGNWYDTGSASEASRLWQHLRLAGLAAGTSNPAAPDFAAKGSLGQPLGLQSGTDDPARTPIRNAQGKALPGGLIVCARAVPGRLVQSVDASLDDGDPATGNMLAAPDDGSYAVGAPAAAAIDPDQTYVVCLGS